MSSVLRFTYKCSAIFFLAISLPSVSYGSDLKESVKAILKSPAHESAEGKAETDVWQQHAEAMRALMVDVFPVLTDLLTDYDYGYPAAETMLRLDRGRAVLLILKAAPDADRSVQDLAFYEFMSNYFGPSHDSSGAALAHTAAVAVIENEYSPADTVEAAAYVIGLTGSERDFPLLERIYAQNNRPGLWPTKQRSAAEAALAKLGSRRHIENLKAELQRPVPKHLDLDTAGVIESWLHEAAFIGSEELVPLVCPHLKDPSAWEGDAGTMPAQTAASALAAIIEKRDPFRTWFDTEKLSTICRPWQ